MGMESLINAAGFAVGVLLAGLVATAPRPFAPGGRWLATLLLCFAFLALGDWLESSRMVLTVPHLGHVFDPLILLVGPLMLGYVRELTERRPIGWSGALLHLLPFLLLVSLLSPFYLQNAADKRLTLEVELTTPPAFDPALAIAAVLVLLYFLASLATLRRYQQQLPAHYSALESRSYGSINATLAVLCAMWVVWVLAILGAGEWARWLDRIAVPLAMYGLGWFGLRQRLVKSDHLLSQELAPAAQLLPQPEQLPTTAVAGALTTIKYQRSGLTGERANEHLRRLEEIMSTEKPYLENDLTLRQLAERIDISAHHLSQLFNEQLRQNFFDYINARRVADVQRCLTDAAYDNEPILNIAMQAGFSSKTAFNAAFRKHAGVTPSAYRAATRRPR